MVWGIALEWGKLQNSPLHCSSGHTCSCKRNLRCYLLLLLLLHYQCAWCFTENTAEDSSLLQAAHSLLCSNKHFCYPADNKPCHWVMMKLLPQVEVKEYSLRAGKLLGQLSITWISFSTLGMVNNDIAYTHVCPWVPILMRVPPPPPKSVIWFYLRQLFERMKFTQYICHI